MPETPAADDHATPARAPRTSRGRSLLRWLWGAVATAVMVWGLILFLRHQRLMHWVQDVESRRGKVVFDVEAVPEWLVDLVGEEFTYSFCPPTFLTLVEPTDADLDQLVSSDNLSQARNLSLICPQLTAVGWARLAELELLQFLRLNEDATLLQDRDLILQLDRLEMLRIYDTTLTSDESVENLRLLPKLRNLVLNSVPLSDRQIEIISRLTTLEQLTIIGTPVDVEKLKSKLPGCEIIGSANRGGP